MSTADFSSKTVKRNMTRSTGKLNLRTAEQERVRLTAAQQKQIQRLYENAAKEVAKQAEKAPRVPSDALRKQYLNQLQNQLNKELDKIRGEIESTVKGNMKKTAEAVVGDNADFLKRVGIPVQGAFSHVPDETVRAVATGQLYEGKWSLSRAIWKNNRRTQKDVQNVVAQGIAQNKSAYDIAKDLEKYVDPSAKKDWDWSKVYPGTARKVDYSAQRLARTMISHAYQQSFVKTTQKNPFVTKYKWVSSGGARMCEICAERDGVEYSKTDLPLDHPNGMCTFVAVIEDSMTDIADRIADWALGGSDPELDNWAESLYEQQGITPESVKGSVHYQTMSQSQFDMFSSQQQVTQEDLDVLHDWYVHTGQSFTVNEILRTGGYQSSEFKDAVSVMSKVCNSNTIPMDCKLYRRVDDEYLDAVFGVDSFSFLNKMRNGTLTSEMTEQFMSDLNNKISDQSFTEKSFLSTSAVAEKRAYVKKPVSIVFETNAGKRGYVTDNKAESEVLFAPGQKYEFTGARILEEDIEGTKVNTLELVARFLSD